MSLGERHVWFHNFQSHSACRTFWDKGFGFPVSIKHKIRYRYFRFRLSSKTNDWFRSFTKTSFDVSFWNKQKLFHFRRINSLESLYDHSWWYRNIPLSLEKIPNTYKIYLKCLKHFQTHFQKSYYFETSFSHTHLACFCLKKGLWKKICFFNEFKKLF